MPRRSNRSRRRRVTTLSVTLLLTAGLTLLAAFPLAPRVARWLTETRHLDRLETARGEALRDALNFVALHADDRPAFREKVFAALDDLDDSRFNAAANALDIAGVWSRRAAGDDVWIRYLGRLAASDDATSRVSASRGLVELPDLADREAVSDAVARLLRDTEPRVRVNALTTLATLGVHAPRRYQPLLIPLTRDEVDAVARRAWVLLGLFGERFPDLPPPPTPIDPAERPGLELPAAWAAARADHDPQRIAELQRLIAHEDDAVRLAVRYATARADLAADLAIREGPFDLPDDATPDALRAALSAADPAVREVAAAYAAKRFPPEPLRPLARELLVGFDDDARLGGAVLAGLAGLRPTAIAGGLSAVLADRPDLTRDAVLAMGDDALAELGLRRVDALLARHDTETDWARRQTFRLALWMRGDDPPPAADGDATPPETVDAVRQLLLRDDVPKSTVLLALLHRGHADVATRWLLNPAGEPPLDLDALLANRRWWYVLEPYLRPLAGEDHPVPAVWPDGPPEVRRLQYDILREWALMNSQ